jgi:rod shape determining protein RodA
MGRAQPNINLRSSVFEWPLVLVSLVLAIVGLGLIYSAVSPMGPNGRSFILRQLTWSSLGLVMMAVFLLMDYRVLERWAIWFYVAMVAALIVVWAVGKVTAGSKRWIDFGLMRFQPSEFAKLAVVFVLAKYFQGNPGRNVLRGPDLIKPLAMVALPVGLVLVQPDLGTAMVIALVAICMIVFVGVSRSVWLWALGAGGAAIPVLLILGHRFLLGYQKQRLTTFLNPGLDPLGSGYHIIQSQIAIGSGGIFGKGFLHGTQNQLMFLPVKHTDFIFSTLAEEWGFIGCMTVLTLFSILFLRGLGVAAKARDSFGALTAFGCTIIIFWHLMINIAMVTGMIPVVGVPLSFLSYGGSSLVSSFLVIGILVNISMRRFTY